MSSRNRVTVIATLVLVMCMGLSVLTLRAVDRVRGESTLQEVLYIPSANTVKHLSLGYNGLLADLYWTRVVQYFGGKHHVKSKQYELLKPLLQITTTLDCNLSSPMSSARCSSRNNRRRVRAIPRPQLSGAARH